MDTSACGKKKGQNRDISILNVSVCERKRDQVSQAADISPPRAQMILCSGGKSTENLHPSTSTASLLKYYSTTSETTGVKEILK